MCQHIDISTQDMKKCQNRSDVVLIVTYENVPGLIGQFSYCWEHCLESVKHGCFDQATIKFKRLTQQER